MQSNFRDYKVGDVVIIYDDGGYYAGHPYRLAVNNLQRSIGYEGRLDMKPIDSFPLNKKVTIIGFQKLSSDDCLIVRYNRKAYWISVSSFRKKNKSKKKLINIVNKTNPRRTKDILKRYWEE
jgi:hypothetical protein